MRSIEKAVAKYKGKFTEQSTPYPVSKEERTEIEQLESAGSDERISPTEMLEITGTLNWPAQMTRPEILHIVALLCVFGQSAGPKHFELAMWVLGYLVRTKQMGITFGGRLKVPSGLSPHPDGFANS